MIRDVGLYDKFTYDGDECLRLYIGYRNGTVSMDDLIRTVKMHVVSRIRHAYARRVRGDVCEDLIQSAMVELWLLFASDREVPTATTAVFHSYLNTVIHRRVAREFAAVYDDAPKRLDPVAYSEMQCLRIPSHDATENEHAAAELHEKLLGRVVANLRSCHPNVRAAQVFVAQELLRHGEQVAMISPLYLRRTYNIEDTEFLIEHVLVLIRAEKYKMREDWSFPSTTQQRSVLYEGLDEYFGFSA